MKKVIKNLLAFLIPVVIVIIIMAIKNVYPFGHFSPRMYDSFHQYTGFLLNFKHFDFYSLKAGLGFNYYATACYYLLSPINILLLFSDIFNIDVIFSIIFIIKIGLAGLTMNILLNSVDSKKETLLFSLFYALSGFIITYYYNIMWLDSIYLLPLVILGINRLINKGKPLIYVLFLSLTIIANFYTGYMVCIFITIYFIFTLINTEKEKRKKAIINFIIYSLLAGLISSVVLLPAFFGLLMGKASGYLRHDFTNYYGVNNNIYLILYKLSPGTYFSGDQNNTGAMIIYSTIYAFVLFIFSFFNTKFSKKYKIGLGIILIIFILSFSFNVFDYAWQFFQRPVWWNHRYSFIFSFFIIYYAYQCYLKKDGIIINKPQKILLITLSITLFAASFAYRYINLTYVPHKIVTIIFGTFAILLLLNYYIFINNQYYKRYILLLIMLELLLNTFVTFSGNKSNRSIESLKIYNKATTKIINKIPNKNDYRAELIDKHVFNDGLIYEYNGINYFNSVRNQNFVSFCENYLNFKVNSHCSTVIDYFDPILLNFFNIKYLIGSEQNYYEPVAKYYNSYVYETPFDSSYGYLVDAKTKDLKLSSDNKYNNLTTILNTMINEKNLYYHQFDIYDYKLIFENATYKNKTVEIIDESRLITATIYFTNKEKKLLISNSKFSLNNNIMVKINDQTYQPKGLYFLLNENDKVSISINYDPKELSLDDFKFLYMNVDDLNNAINNLDQNRLIMDNNDGHLLKGHVDVKDRKTLFLSLPYEDGFIIKVDGKKVPYYKILDAFVAIDLEEGKHEITIDYVSKGFNIGLLLSISGVSICTILLIINKCYNKDE